MRYFLPLLLIILVLTATVACQNNSVGERSHLSKMPEKTMAHAPNDSSTLQTSIVAALQNKDWQVVKTADHVKYKPENRQDEADLSFRYKAKIMDDALYLLVEVQDEMVIFKDGIDEVVSDHIELWVSDYAIQAKLQDFIEAHQQFITKHEPLEKMAQEMDNPEDARFYATAIEASKAYIADYQERKDYLQILFNQKVGFVFPDKKIKPDYDFAYSPSSTGYTFALRLPLDRKFNVLSEKVYQLGFMIDVIDMDTPDATKQECLMSSSKIRKYGQPNTFDFLLAQPPIDISLPHTAEFDQQLDSIGIFIYNNDTYTYLVNEPYVYSGIYGMNKAILPGKYVSLVEKVLQKPEDNPQNVALRAYENKLILEHGPQKVAFSSDSLIHSSSRGLAFYLLYGNGEHYLLHSVSPSRYPMGNGFCGAGLEMDLIYLQIGSDLTIQQSKTHHIESCFKNIVIESDSFLAERDQLRPVKQGAIWTLESSTRDADNKPLRLQWQFDPSQPHLGIQQ